VYLASGTAQRAVTSPALENFCGRRSCQRFAVNGNQRRQLSQLLIQHARRPSQCSLPAQE